jgi:hypothetical protein
MDREKTAGGITGGLMLIGIGVLAFTGGWWPGIMVVIGIAIIGGMLYRRQFLSILPVAFIFFGIPAVVELGLSWNTFIPLLLIGLGLLSLVDNLARSRRRAVVAAGESGSTQRFEYRSGFWPVMFLGVGIIWLLGNQGYIPGFNPYALVSLWPLLLVGLGLDLLIGRRSLLIGALIGLAMLAVAAGLLLTRPDMLPQFELQSAEFSEPLGQTTSAEFFVELNGGQNQLIALSEADNLIEASLIYLGTVDFSVSGDQAKQIELTTSGLPFVPLIGSLLAGQKADIGLSKAVPVAITLENSDGDTQLELGDLQLAGLEFRISGGKVTASLPAAGENLRSDINQSGGDLSIQLTPESAGDFRVVISGGNLIFEIPDQADVRVEVLNQSGGEVDVPEHFVQTQIGDNGEGVWETPGFAQGEHPIVITVDNISGGDVVIR